MKVSAALERKAVSNLTKLMDNPYPGRGIINGRTRDGNHLAQVAWLMGRRPSSRNRRYVHEGDVVRTEAIDPSIPVDPLTIYNAMLEKDGHYVVSNGVQTDAILEGLEKGEDLTDILMEWEHEPDEPNFTPRISGACTLKPLRIELAILRKDGAIGCHQSHYEFKPDALPPGYGYCLHTYAGDGNPLPSFSDEPFLVPLRLPFNGNVAEVSNFCWASLNYENRVALVTKFIDIKTGASRVHINNRF